MPPYRSASASSDDEEAPESFSLAQSKRDVQQHVDTLKQFQANEKEKKRVRNRERDRRLKERAESNKRRRREVSDGLEARMKKAMEEEAEVDVNEGDDHRQGEDGEESQDNIIANAGDKQGSGESDVGEDSGSEHDGEETDEELHPNNPPTMPNPNHLPDHLFTAAFTAHAAKSNTSLAKRKADEENPKHRSKKRTRHNNTPKDVVVGSRTFRTLTYDQRPSGAGILPSSKVKKFIDRTLALKGGNPKSRGWERRAANIGSMRRSGPAANFVRNC